MTRMKRLKLVLSSLCLAVSIMAFLMFLQNWANGRTAGSQWAFATAIIGWICCTLLRRDTEEEKDE
jgi:hypothetical protein